MFQPLLDALLPVACVACGLPGHQDIALCAECHAELPRSPLRCAGCALAVAVPGRCVGCARQPPVWGEAHAAFDYRDALTHLLPRFKFHGDLAAGRALADAALTALVAAPRPQALVPLPLHRARLRQRGFNQAQLLARDWGRALRLPVLGNALQRVHTTAAQTRLSRSERQRNLHHAFSAGGSLPVHVAIVDDVLTTGATATDAAEALLAAGVSRVDVWVLARTP